MERGWMRFYLWLLENCPLDPPDCLQESRAILEDLIASGVKPTERLFKRFTEIMPSVWAGMRLADRLLEKKGR